jgi:hypothetical protein
VTMSAPDASCALTMTACDEYLPVPMMRRDANVLPAIEKVFMLSAADKIDDLYVIALAHDGGVKHRTLEDDEVVLDGDAARVDVEHRQQFADRERTGKVEGIAVQRNGHPGRPVRGAILSHIDTRGLFRIRIRE